MRAYKPSQLFGLIQSVDVLTMLFYGLTGPRGQRSITFRTQDNRIIGEHITKIQGMTIDLFEPSHFAPSYRPSAISHTLFESHAPLSHG